MQKKLVRALLCMLLGRLLLVMWLPIGEFKVKDEAINSGHVQNLTEQRERLPSFAPYL